MSKERSTKDKLRSRREVINEGLTRRKSIIYIRFQFMCCRIEIKISKYNFCHLQEFYEYLRVYSLYENCLSRSEKTDFISSIKI